MTFSDETKRVIIKRGSTDIIGPPSDRKVLSKQEVDASKIAQQIIEEATQKAESIINEKEAGVKIAKDEGFQEGYKEGLKSINKILIELNNFKNNAIISTEVDIIKLAFKISRKILGYELDRNDEAVISIIKEVLKASRHQKSIKISVNPEDFSVINQKRDILSSVLTKYESFIIETNDNIKQGGCEIETEIGTISADLDTQLDILESLLLNREA